MPKNKAKIWRTLLVVLTALVLLVAISETGRNTLIVLWQLLFQKEVKVEKEGERINVLLLGAAGGTHEGKDLTDTIIILSVDPVKKETLLISIPRDLWIPELSAKINTAYALSEEKKEGGGLVLAKAVAEKVAGMEVDYGVKVDFTGFVKAVDSISGLDIEVENVFEDPGYPIEGRENDLCGIAEEEVEKVATPVAKLWEVFPCRFEQIAFTKGKMHMDGATALKFVRSRNAEGVEGTDFARSRRQQKVLSAFSDKIFSLGVLLNPLKVQNLFMIVRENVDTDIPTNQLDDFIRLAKQLENTSARSVVIDDGDENNGRAGLLVNPLISEQFNFQWVLIPRVGNGNFSEIHDYIKCQLAPQDCQIK